MDAQTRALCAIEVHDVADGGRRGQSLDYDANRAIKFDYERDGEKERSESFVRAKIERTRSRVRRLSAPVDLASNRQQRINSLVVYNGARFVRR